MAYWDHFGYLTMTNNGLALSLLTPADLEVNKQEILDIFYDPQKLLLFDAETGRNLSYNGT